MAVVPVATRPDSRWATFWRTNTPEYLLLLGIFAGRMHRLTVMPLYWDETFHVQQARLIMLGRYFAPQDTQDANLGGFISYT